MKRFISFVLAAVMSSVYIMGITTAGAAENLLQNGGFESTLLASDWAFAGRGNWIASCNGADNITQSSDKAHGGSCSVKINDGTIGQRISLSAGTDYSLSLYAMADAETSAPKVCFCDGSTNWPNDKPVGDKQSISVTGEWQEFTMSFHCDASKDYVICVEAWDAGAVYIDDVTLTAEEAETSDSKIVNGNFSAGLDGWTVSEPTAASAADGVLTAQGTVRVSQTVEGLESGSYNLVAYAYTSDIKETGASYLYAKTDGSVMASTSIPEGSAAYKIVVPNITVGNDGTCDIGINLVESESVTIDNIAFEPAEETRVKFYKGGEISKITYVEDNGGKFYRADGTQGDALQIMAENGFNMARIRLLDDPGPGHGQGGYYLPAGYLTESDCLTMARRAKDKGMAIEFTIAYSDYWVDGEKQMVPRAWQTEITNQNLTGDALVTYLESKVYEYTKDIMQKLAAQGTCPEFVSIGNEIQVGILFNDYQNTNTNGLYNNANYLKRLIKQGARAVREVSPETKIILHSDNGGNVSARSTFKNILDDSSMSEYYDVIGASYYPFYNGTYSIDTVVSEFNTFVNKYDKDVIIMETGYNWNAKRGDSFEGQLEDNGYYQNTYGETKEGQRAFLTELYAKLKQVAGGRCIGDLYWDPVMIYDGRKYKIGWAVNDSGYTQGNVISNSTIFDFSGKALPGQLAMKYNTESNDTLNIAGKIKSGASAAAGKTVTFTVNGKKYNRTTDKFGDYIVSVPYPADGKVSISLKGSVTDYPDETAVTDGVLMSGYNFDDFDASTEPDAESTPTPEPTITPVVEPTEEPTAMPEVTPTITPSASPSVTPEAAQTAEPTITPVVEPTYEPTEEPTAVPEVTPEIMPSESPSVTPEITPSVAPTVTPEAEQTAEPTITPVVEPTYEPTEEPTAVPEVTPEIPPSESPSVTPEIPPSASPSVTPEAAQTAEPTITPVVEPTAKPVFDITGTVRNHDGSAAQQLSLTLKPTGRTSVTDGSGGYKFENLAAGSYNIVIVTGDGGTVTKFVTVAEDGTVTGADITLPPAEISSSVVAGQSTGSQDIKVEEIVAGGLDELAEYIAEGAGSEPVDVKMTIESKAEDNNDTVQQAIKDKAEEENINYINIDITKTVGEGQPEAVPETPALITVVIPFDMEGKSSVKVYRYHGNEAEIMSPSTGTEEGYRIGSDAVTIYANKFSTYAIAYNNTVASPSPSTAPGGGVSSAHGSGGSGKPKTTPKPSASPSASPSVQPGTSQPEEPQDTAKPAENAPEQTEPIGFKDVNPGDWFYDAVKKVCEGGIMEGVSAEGTEFGPGMPLTRGMLATVLGRLDGVTPTGTESGYTDVPAAAYYAPYVAWGTENGILNGMGDGTFRPDEYVTREQTAKIIKAYYDYKGEGPTGAWAIRLDYTDIAKISDWAVEGVMFCTMKDIMIGREDGSFDPKAGITRAECAAVIERIE